MYFVPSEDYFKLACFTERVLFENLGREQFGGAIVGIYQQLLAEREEVLGKRLQGEVLANLPKYLRKVKGGGGGTVLKTFRIFLDAREWNVLKEAERA